MESSRSCSTSRTSGSGHQCARTPRPSHRLFAAGRHRRASCIAAVALVFAAALVSQGRAAGLPEDTGSFNFSASRQASAESNSRAVLDPQSERLGLKPRAEYGLTDDLTVGFNNEYQFIKSGLESERTTRTDGLVNTELFLRGTLPDQDWYRLSVQDMVHLPGEESEAGLSHGASSLNLQYGRSGRLAGGTWSSSIRNGFMPQLDDAPDRLQTDLSLGWRPNAAWQFTAQSLNSLSFEGAEGVPAGDISRGQLSVLRNFSKSLSLQVSGWETVAGDVADNSNGFDAIVWLRY